ncbi:SDR family oxidoreductase [Nakamurella sp.]|uniref:SDR family oxidoreductase n=1 Tax=Nakamurella sp. TaxID=1869182 RepID=UPI003B3BDDA1
MTIAVTGATGQLGALVVRDLVRAVDPASVVAVVRDPAKATGLAAQGVQVRPATYAEPDALATAFAGVDDLLFVSSSEVGQRVDQHRAVIDAAVAAGVGRVVYTSAPRATTSSLVLAPEHKFTEEYLAASGLPATILRNNWYTENYLGQIEIARKTGTLVAAAGAGRVASASRADFAAAAVAVLTQDGHAGRVYELGGDHAWDYDELAAALAEIVGSPVRYRAVDGPTLIGILQQTGMDEGTAGFVARLDGDIAGGALGEVTGELSALIGRPTTPLLEGLRAAAG